MSILTKYLIREIIKHLSIILAVVITIYLAVDFFEKIDSFLQTSVPANQVFWFFLFKMPLVTVQMLPICLLLAVLVTFGMMNKRNELIALKSSGVSIFHLFKPVAVLGIFCAMLLFCLSEMVVPTTMARSNGIWLKEVKKVSALTTRKNIWIKGDRAIFKIVQYDPVNRIMHGFSAYYLDDQFRLIRRLDAQQGERRDNQWVFGDLLVQELDPVSGTPDTSFHDRKAVNIELLPEDLEQIAKSSDEMSYKMLLALIQGVEAAGDDATRYRVDLNYKLAFPMVCLIMCLIGTGVAVRRKLREGLPMIISYGIAIAFLYWIVLSFCVSLGYGAKLPPIAAAWAANLIFLCVGGLTLINAE